MGLISRVSSRTYRDLRKMLRFPRFSKILKSSNRFFDCYAALGLPHTASYEQIKTKYIQLSAQYHPDRNQNDTFAKKRFYEVQKAYQELQNTRRKTEYEDKYSKTKQNNVTIKTFWDPETNQEYKYHYKVDPLEIKSYDHGAETNKQKRWLARKAGISDSDVLQLKREWLSKILGIVCFFLAVKYSYYRWHLRSQAQIVNNPLDDDPYEKYRVEKITERLDAAEKGEIPLSEEEENEMLKALDRMGIK